MKNLVLALLFLATTYPQQFHSLKGIEDEQGNTILLYRYGSESYSFNPIYKLNTVSFEESLLMQAFYSIYPLSLIHI